MSGPIVWGNNDKTLYYLQSEKMTKRPYRLYQWTMGEEPLEEKRKPLLLYEESDPAYWCDSLTKSFDQRFLFLSMSSPSTETSETWFIDLLQSTLRVHFGSYDDSKQLASSSSRPLIKCIAKRCLGIHYRVEHRHGKWWIVSNYNPTRRSSNESYGGGGSEATTSNLRLWVAPALEGSQSAWRRVVRKKQNSTDNVNDQKHTKKWFDGGALDPSIDQLFVFSSAVVVQ